MTRDTIRERLIAAVIEFEGHESALQIMRRTERSCRCDYFARFESDTGVGWRNCLVNEPDRSTWCQPCHHLAALRDQRKDKQRLRNNSKDRMRRLARRMCDVLDEELEC